MKKFFLFLLASISFQFASSQELVMKYNMRSPEDKTKLAMDKLQSFKLKKDDNEKVAKVIGEFYKDQQKMLDGAIKNGVGDVNAYKAKKLKHVADRDDKLKKIFSKDQFKTWIEVIEPSLKPQRPSA